MNRLSNRLARLERLTATAAAPGPVHTLIVEPNEDGDRMVADMIARGDAGAADQFILLNIVDVGARQ